MSLSPPKKFSPSSRKENPTNDTQSPRTNSMDELITFPGESQATKSLIHLTQTNFSVPLTFHKRNYLVKVTNGKLPNLQTIRSKFQSKNLFLTIFLLFIYPMY